MIPELLTQIRSKLKRYVAGKGSIIHKTALVSPSVKMGDFCEIHPYTILDTKFGSIELGNNVSVNANSVIYGQGGVKIGNDVRIAAHVVIVPANHNYQAPETLIREQGMTRKGIEIGDDVWIGAGAKILDGVKIGEGCVIAAGAIVTKSTEPYSVYGGVPAQKIKERTH